MNVQFAPVVQLGQLISAAFIAVTVFGSAYGFYMDVEHTIDVARSDIGMLKLRLDRDEAETIANTNYIRDTLDRISAQISDLKVSVANGGKQR